MKCLACKNEMMIDTTTTYFVNLQDYYVIVENVPCKKCTQCGEEVFSLSVMERIDEIVAGITKKDSKVCIMEYKSVA